MKDSARKAMYAGRGKPNATLTKNEYNKIYPLLLGGLPNESDKKMLTNLGDKYGYDWNKSQIEFLDSNRNLWIKKIKKQ